jgi:very-short-patch-repair endonuclease
MHSWCPYCVNKTEQKLYDALIKIYPSLQQQFKVDWCKKQTYLPFDFVIDKYNIIIELDGRQHFEQVSNWDNPIKTHKNDVYKMKCANQNKYSVIRLLQEDVFYDTYDWLSELKLSIKKIISDETIQNVYMCKNNEYDIFDEKILTVMSEDIKRINHMMDRMHKITQNRIKQFNKLKIL